MDSKVGFDQKDLQAKRVIQTHEEKINASSSQIFPLLCPVQEYKWIDQWDCLIVYSDSGVIENNCIFIEDKTGRVLFNEAIPTVWTASLHDPEHAKLQFVLQAEKLAIIKIDAEVRDAGDGKSSVSWTMTITALPGSTATDDAVAKRAKLYLTAIGKSLKHYCEKGEIFQLNKMNLIRMGFSVGIVELLRGHLEKN